MAAEDVVEALRRAGGIAGTRLLVAATSRRSLRSAVRRGLVHRLRRGCYRLAEVDEARATAERLAGVLCLLSAALHWGWAVKFPPTQPQVMVPRGRKVGAARRAGVDLRWARLDPADTVATSPVRTVIDCARFLPFEDALAVADSALRSKMVTRTALLLAAARSPRSGRSRVFRVVEAADPRAANPFESVLRAILLEVTELDAVPQQWVGSIGRPDLVDRRNRLIIEAESWEYHGSREAFLNDVTRYTAFVCAGWVVLRFTWDEVMFQPDYVRECVRSVLRPGGRTARACPDCRAA